MQLPVPGVHAPGPLQQRIVPSAITADTALGIVPTTRLRLRLTRRPVRQQLHRQQQRDRRPPGHQHRLPGQHRRGRDIRRQKTPRSPAQQPATRRTVPDGHHPRRASADRPSPAATNHPPTAATTTRSPHPRHPAERNPADGRTRHTPQPARPPTHSHTAATHQDQATRPSPPGADLRPGPTPRRSRPSHRPIPGRRTKPPLHHQPPNKNPLVCPATICMWPRRGHQITSTCFRRSGPTWALPAGLPLVHSKSAAEEDHLSSAACPHMALPQVRGGPQRSWDAIGDVRRFEPYGVAGSKHFRHALPYELIREFAPS